MVKTIGDSLLLDAWASSGAVVEPDLTKIEDGWELQERPPHEYMNWLHQTAIIKINHLLQNGVPEWNGTTTYRVGDLVKRSAVVYRAIVANTNSAPPTANWTKFVPDSKIFQSPTVGGTANAITLTNPVPFGIAAYADHMIFVFRALSNITGPVTINVDARGALGLKWMGADLQNLDILAGDEVVCVKAASTLQLLSHPRVTDRLTSTSIAAGSVLGRATDAGSGVTQVLTPTQLREILKSVDGTGSGIDADLLRGIAPATANTGNTIAQRDVNGYLRAAYLNQSSAIEAPVIGAFFIQASNADGFLRKVSPESVADRLDALIQPTWGNIQGKPLKYPDAELLDGLNSAVAASPSTILARDLNGDVYSRFFNMTGAAENTAASTILFTNGSDTYLRRVPFATLLNQIEAALGLTTWSTPISFVTNGSQKKTFVHNLGILGYLILAQVKLVCISSDAGYANGDVLIWNSVNPDNSNAMAAVVNEITGAVCNQTSFIIATAIHVPHKTTFVNTIIDLTKWQLRIGVSKV